MSEGPGGERLIAGRYRLLTPLGQGGMGTVWRARDEVLHREVAVKEVRAPAGLPANEVERMYARLEREAWAAARVANRNVVTVYDVAAQDGRPWIVMELVRGISLAELLDAEGPLAPARAAYVGAEVLSALRAAHDAGVLHRDVKPANVLLSNDDRVVLTDFGIATYEGSSAITMTGEVIGSPEFLAPERALGRTPGPESDLWSLGVLLYTAVEGQSPFRQDTPLSTLRAIVDEELPPPRRAGPLSPVIEGLLRKDPAERLPAGRAEQDLRIIAAGGTARTVPYTPTLAAAPPPPPPPYQQPSYRQQPATEPLVRDQPESAGGNRRATAVLVAGVLAIALAIGGLTYALLNNRDGGEAKGGQQTNSQSQGVSSPPASRSEEPSESPTPSPSASKSSSPPPQTVAVSVSGRGTEYSGPCPPEQSAAPAFTATFTVGRVPATVSYRWVSKDGKAVDSGWRTLEFAGGGSRSQQARVFLTTGRQSGTFENELWVEVRRPAKATSNSVPFSVTCEEETPSGEASPSPSATY
ncbi:serine/threonine protein kinase [Streptomyces roseirectus]|uniref:non-specific serine/threonine protein kinase n=1 Tax=Streptomyces roseirectus TaxID=2768066 RepID=A0A7H0ILB6_9ACTN|nr:serine/threonine-protein kinase [Streptomyces roseirectus]QNP73582.1 serine/threonine protein kinase [Streptomyces roseirectus]